MTQTDPFSSSDFLSTLAITNDEPSEHDLLGRETLLLGVSNLIINTKPPLVIGIEGKWGEGKTSFMRALKSLFSKNDRLKNAGPVNADGDNNTFKKFDDIFGGDVDLPTIWFNPWSAQFEKEPIIPLLDAIKAQIPPSVWEKALNSVKSIVDDPTVRVMSKAALGVGEALGPGWLGALAKQGTKLIEGSKSKDDAFQSVANIGKNLETSFERILASYPTGEGQAKPAKLIIFIDDVDRCEAPYIVKILESLKLHLLNEHCVFVMGVAIEKIKDALVSEKVVPDDAAARNYLEKIIQLPVKLPVIWDPSLEAYLASIAGPLLPPQDMPHKFEPCFNLLKAFSTNPRTLKQFFSWYSLQTSMVMIAKDLSYYCRNIVHDPALMLKIRLLQFNWPDAYTVPDDFYKDAATAEVATETNTNNIQRPGFEQLEPRVGDWLNQNTDNVLQLQLFLALSKDKNIAKRKEEQLRSLQAQRLSVFEPYNGDWTITCTLNGQAEAPINILGLVVGEEGRISAGNADKTTRISGSLDIIAKTISFNLITDGSVTSMYEGFEGNTTAPGLITGERTLFVDTDGRPFPQEGGSFRMVKSM